MNEKVVAIKSTGVGAKKLAISLDPTLKIKEFWGKTHGEAVIRGYGRYVWVDVSSRGNHYCQVIERFEDGTEKVIESVSGVKYCRICETYL